ncbi:Cellulose synthase operon protein C [Salmonella enterica subsp. arizonae]|uniref:Cellulose synthase operon protein C n=1 Tax=Salmonella enterica subsp. arizonae TaxID=59203 RepID=A0A3S4FYH2_SALER|nr:Cellulose synthase operon protein C [Salmonella enterica subsp. arizonae]
MAGRAARPGRCANALTGAAEAKRSGTGLCLWLYLSGSDRDRAALAHLNTLPPSQWNSNIQELADRLQSNQALESANRLRDSGKEREAEALLRQQPPSTRIALTLADWAQQRGDNAAARAAYDAVLAREPGNVDAMLGRVEIDIAQGDNAAARAQLAALPAAQIASINMQRRVALAQLQLGDIAAAARTFNRITPQAKAQPPSMESAMVLRDAADFRRKRASRSGRWRPTKMPWSRRRLRRFVHRITIPLPD